jgi:putative resolvase
MSTSGRLLNVKEVALLLNVSRQALWKWIKGGKIKADKLPSGRFRIPESELVRILQAA